MKLITPSKRKSSYVRMFTSKPEELCPGFPTCGWGVNACPHECAYCFLQLTQRYTGPIRYEDVDKLVDDVNRWERLRERHDQPERLLNFGEMGDPLADEWMYQHLPEIIARTNAHILLLTKSSRTPLDIPSDQRYRIHVAYSVTHPDFARRWEHGAAAVEDRLWAMLRAQSMGYPVRVRIDPMTTRLEDSADLLDWTSVPVGQMFSLIATALPEVVTLGTLRFQPGMVQHVPAGLFGMTRGSRGRRRLPLEERVKLYQQATALLRLAGYHGPVALCKESEEAWALYYGPDWERRKSNLICNCTLKERSL